MAASRVCSGFSRQLLSGALPQSKASPLAALSAAQSKQSSQRTRQCTQQRRWIASDTSGLRSLLHVSEEVAEAVATKKPVVALESTIYTHGAMGKQLAQEHDELVRSHGGIPAIIGILKGVPKVGLTPQEIVSMIEDKDTTKVSRRDISYLVGMGIAGRKISGGTTIAGTMVLARLAGISVFGTGGLGGVHRDGENTMDISADLTELGRTRVAVVSSGCKGFLDIGRTLEFLETQGALVSTFADGRSGALDFPGFWARDSGFKSPSVIQSEKEAAAIIYSQEQLGIESGMLFANPVPAGKDIPLPEIQAAIETAVTEATQKGFTGSRNTPYVLQRLKELTGNKAVVANIALVESNIIRATNVAVELSRLQASGPSATASSQPIVTSTKTAPVQTAVKPETEKKTDILVAGAVALDLNCDYAGRKAGDIAPQAHTSNPSHISQSIGGVGHNVALAAHRASSQNKVKLCSMVGDDVAGSTILAAVEASGLDATHVRRLGQEYKTGNRTAQYVAVNDGEKNLVMAMADMDIFTTHSFPDHWRSVVEDTKPDWLVVDGNWAGKDIREWVRAGADNGSKVAFEPVSVAKSRGLFTPQRGLPKLGIFPNSSLRLASPNTYELAAMYEEAKENGYLDDLEWFQVVDWFGMRGARERFVHLTSAELTDAGVPVQSVNLLPYIPTIITKLGAQGVLLTELLERDDPRLRDRDSEEYILTRCMSPNSPVGGIYMRLYPAAERVTDVVSVNGVGDTFLGVMIAGLAQGGKIEKLVDVAQRGAVHTLRSAEAVSPRLGEIEAELTRVVSRR